MPDNEKYTELSQETFRDFCISLGSNGQYMPRLMFAADLRQIHNCFRIYAVFSEIGKDIFHIPFFSLRADETGYNSLTPDIPAFHWYEREIMDMFGLVPEGHPDSRRLVFHDAFPAQSWPLRKDWSITNADLIEWGAGTAKKVPYNFMKVDGEGIYEIPVGPVHAGIIEPGHFRFSAIGETIFFLEPRLFYTHKGTEKLFEGMSFQEGIRLAERVSGTSSFSHSSAYCMAVERMTGVELSEKAAAVRTILLELERLYNHIGDIGNMCAGTSVSVGNAGGSLIKEKLLQLNKRLTGSRYLRGINTIGGVTGDIFTHADDILKTVDEVNAEFKSFMKILLGTISHVERLENTGVLSKDIALKLGVTGVAARASGIHDDIRKSHPYLLYDRLVFEPHTSERGDVYARMMVRAEEAESSISMINALLETGHRGELTSGHVHIPPESSALGYTETPRGSLFYYVMSDSAGRPARVKLRSPSYCNWPAVPYAVHGEMVPDFPLCNKSFNLSYSGCDM